MIQRTIATLILIFLALSLVGATPRTEAKRLAVLSPDYAIVDDNPILTRGYYPTITAAVGSGATTIEVRAGVYPESVVIDRELAIKCNHGATIINNGTHVSFWLNVPNITIDGCKVQGSHDGLSLGDFFNGTAFMVQSDHITLRNVEVVNNRSFAILLPTTAAHDVLIENCRLSNVATSPTPQLLAGTAIQFINGVDGGVVQGCEITGYSQTLAVWYGSRNVDLIQNILTNNYGWIGGGFSRTTIDTNKDLLITNDEWAGASKADGLAFGARSDIEFYGLPGAEVVGVRAIGNRVDGSNGSGFELADSLENVEVRGNEVRNVVAGFWMGGSGDNKSLDAVIADNHFYGHAGVVSNWFSGTGVISGNHFEGWDSEGVNNTGVIYVPSDGLGEVEVVGNTFKDTGRVLRYSAPTGDLWFMGNDINTDSSAWMLYFSDTINGGHVIADNTFTAPNAVTIISNQPTPLTVRDNTIYGGAVVVSGGGSVVSGNTIHCPVGGWTGLLLQADGGVVRDNLAYCDNTPIVVDNGVDNALIERNFVARNDGSTTTVLPVCGPTNTCVRNWTVGQAPPP